MTKQQVIDLLARVNEDEPVFLLQAEDKLAVDLIELWAIRARKLHYPDCKIADGFKTATEMLRWQSQHSHG